MPKRWTHEEKKTLRQLFGTVPAEELESTFGAPYKNIRQVAYRLGVLQKDNILSAAALARALSLPVTTIERWCKKGLIPAIKPAPRDEGYSAWAIDPICLEWVIDRVRPDKKTGKRHYLKTSFTPKAEV